MRTSLVTTGAYRETGVETSGRTPEKVRARQKASRKYELQEAFLSSSRRNWVREF